MTREEAIENLRRLQNLLFNAPYIDTSTIIATCNIAIEALEQTRWIPVSERLPEVGVDVLMCDIEGTIYLSHKSSYGSYFDEWGNKIKNIRAWMPLPQPYEPQESEGRKC